MTGDVTLKFANEEYYLLLNIYFFVCFAILYYSVYVCEHPSLSNPVTHPLFFTIIQVVVWAEVMLSRLSVDVLFSYCGVVGVSCVNHSMCIRLSGFTSIVFWENSSIFVVLLMYIYVSISVRLCCLFLL